MLKEFQNKIICGDALEVLKQMPDGCVDCVITSPPYNFDNGSGLGNKYAGQKDNMPQEEYFKWQKECIKQMIRVCKNCVFYNIQFLAGNKVALCKLIGYFAEYIKEPFIWDKGFAEPAINPGVANSAFEFIIVFGKRGCKRKFENANFKRGTFYNILRIGRNHNKNSDFHSACFPEKLPATLILNFTKEQDIILDPFMGLGTTALAALKHNRNFIGIELNKDYVKLAEERIAYEKSQGKLFV